MLTLKKSPSLYYHLLALAVLIFPILFLKINAFHMRWWDESLFAVNTYEMMHNHKFFSYYSEGLPDLYNTKPPLFIWCQVLSSRIFGYNELALRLPSAVAAAATVLTVFVFVRRWFGHTWGWCSALVLLTSYGFVHFHSARTGDSDALLTVFLFLTNVCFIRYVIQEKKRDVLLFFLFLTLAFTTKLAAALLFTPAYLLILLLHKKLRTFLFNRAFLAGALFFLIAGAGFIYLREADTPGYIKAILAADFGRIGTVIENHDKPFLFYFENFFHLRFAMWAVVFTLGAVLIFFEKDRQRKQLLGMFLLLTGTYLLIVSISATKLEWYDMPLYPLLAVIAAYPIVLLKKHINASENKWKTQAATVMLPLVFVYPYYIMFNKSQGNTIPNDQKKLEACERYLFKRITENKNLDGLTVCYSEHKDALLFYKYRQAELNQQIRITRELLFKPSERVLVSDDSLKKS